jgi:hypothetical protein
MTTGSPEINRLCRITFTSLTTKGITPKLLHFISTGKPVNNKIPRISPEW